MEHKEIGRRLSSRRLELGLTLQDVANAIGVASSTVQRYEAGNVQKIKLPVLEAIARYLGLNPAWVCGKSENKLESSVPDAIPVKQLYRIPIVGTVAAGAPILAEENIEGYDVADIAHPEQYFFLRVKGDSMINAGIKPGDLVLVHRQDYAENGQIVVCIVNGYEATLKRFKLAKDRVVLMPENPAYEPYVLSCEDFENGSAAILGVAVEVKTKLI